MKTKKMNAQQLADYICSLPFGKKVDFAIIDYHSEPSSWYCITTQKGVCDNYFIIADYYGGLQASVASLENNPEQYYNSDNRSVIFEFVQEYFDYIPACNEITVELN